MWRWRMDTSPEDWRQQGITLNLVSTHTRQESLSAKLKWPLRWIEINSQFLRGFSKSNSQLVRILNIMFDVSRNLLVLRIRFHGPENWLHQNFMLKKSSPKQYCKNSKLRGLNCIIPALHTREKLYIRRWEKRFHFFPEYFSLWRGLLE